MITVIANLKGGTGKSTVTFNLAIWLQSMGRRVTAIDLDPQQTLADAAALRIEEGVAPALLVEAGAFPDVDFPGDAEEIIIDVGTADLESFKQAIMIADRILVPVTPSQADIWSTQRFVEFLSRNTHGNPPESITFINRADTSRTIHATDEAAAALDALPGLRLIPQRLSNRSVFRDSFSEGLAVFELEPRSIATREFTELAEALYGPGNRSLLARVQKQKISTLVDPAQRLALAAPAEKLAVHGRVSSERLTAAIVAPAAEADPSREQPLKKGKKKGKKRDKTAAKQHSGSKDRPVKAGKKGKKKKKGRKER
ncbi:MAG: ParA family protein [Chromatiaceae bacterium]|nr:ParA family protein [Chromatiaceae bacterium]